MAHYAVRSASDPERARKLIANAIAVILLFAVGYAYGRITGRHPWQVGIGMVVLGSFVVAGTMALGG